MTQLGEKALEAAVKRYRDKYREFWPGSAPTDNDSRELLLAAFPFSKTTQAGESEIIECLLAGEEFVFDPATHFCHANDGCALENGIKYVPTALQAEPKKYVIGDLTMEKIFKPSGLENLSDLQTVLDAVEEVLADLQAENERLRGGALQFYADAWCFTTNQKRAGIVYVLEWKPKEALLDDCGYVARDALAGLTT